MATQNISITYFFIFLILTLKMNILGLYSSDQYNYLLNTH